VLGATFAWAAVSYWTGVFPRVARHLARWRRSAAEIGDPEMRRLVEASLAKHTNVEGAAAFAAFAPWRSRSEATLGTSAFQAAYNLLDILGEQPSPDPIADGRRLHEALLYALDPLAARQDWYELHPLREDDGYLDGLLEECRGAVRGLPSFAAVAPAARRAAERIVAFQSFNLSEAQGDHEALERWARDATPAGSGLEWWETAAAAGSSLGVHVLIGAAAREQVGELEVAALGDAYFPWIGALHSLLDNLVDEHEDAAAGHRSFVGYYSSQEQMAERLSWLAERAMDAAEALPHGARHRVIVAALIGNYLSAPEARLAGTRALSQRVLAATGPLGGPTMVVFRLRQLGLDSFG
jgi:tetraprenyl-beta-curcumene synthase